MDQQWSEAEKADRKARLDSARNLQENQKNIDINYQKMVQAGARNIIKVTNPGKITPTVTGFVTNVEALAGYSPYEISKILGLRATDLVAGAHVYRLRRLPARDHFVVRGYTTLPDGGSLPENRVADEAGYRAGHGAWQVALTQPVEAEFLGTLAPGMPFSLAAFGKPPNISGAAWWHANQAKYPNSDQVSALRPVFEMAVSRFIRELRGAGARVAVSSTRRNRVRGQLMYYSFLLSRGEVRASQIPPIEGCDIHWDHGDEALSRAAAEEMRALFNIVYKPSLSSLHFSGDAIDMTIQWSRAISVKDAGGRTHRIEGPGDGSYNRTLHAVGLSYGVIKLLRDPPHWSINGH